MAGTSCCGGGCVDLEKAQVQKQDAALKEVTDVTERFNEQLRAWKAKNAAEKKSS